LAREKAKKIGVFVEFREGDVRYIDFGREYDAAMIMFHSFGYFTDEEDRMVLEKVYNVFK